MTPGALRRAAALLALATCPQHASPQAVAGAPIALWPSSAATADVVDGAYVRHVGQASLTAFPAAPGHANGAAIIVVPGGGHRMLVAENEGAAPARILNRFGVTAFVLRYRLAREPGAGLSIERDAAGDVRRAVRWVRAHAADWGVDPHRVGLMGFSAGGELVSLVADNPAPTPAAGAGRPDAVDRVSDRPDFQVLIYPGPLGIPAASAAGAPPAFLAAGTLDACCAEPALTLYRQLRAAGVSAEMHLFADTGHGFNVAAHSERVSLLHWPDRLADWLADGGWLVPGPRRPPVPDSWPPPR